MKKKKNFIVLAAIALFVHTCSAGVCREWNNETEQDSGFHVCYRKYYAQSPRQQRKNQNSIMEIQQYTDRNG